ncbi:MAG: aspartyl/asparaginyl beta-hydroxylase domain-containing protein [Micropepsaceae bacterium]
MPVQDSNVPALKQAGLDALRRGDTASARRHFEEIAEAGRADGLVWLALAAARKALGDKAAAVAAADQVLALEPRNLRALIMKADHHAESGDIPTAVSFYRAALKSAPAAGQIPTEIIRELRRVESVCAQFAHGYEVYLNQRLAEHGFDPARSSRRFAQSLDILHGKKEIFVQQPRHYYFPELPQRQFYEREEFPWLEAVEAATADIREEAEAVLRDDRAFTPYVTRGLKERPRGEDLGMLDNPDWSAFFLWRDGSEMTENAARCPRTMRALERAPLSRVKGRMPSVLFSLLRPGARIPPHTGVLNTRLICHLPLIVPAGCRFRVGNDEREWVEGKAWVFDDTIEHEAWNTSSQLRVVLIFDIWRPEVTDEERNLVAAMLEAIDDHGAAKTRWDV